MYKNGVSHMTAADEFLGVEKIVKWMSYVPDKKNNIVPRILTTDTWDREISYFPPKGPYDVRWLIGGKQDEDGYLSGFFDKDSFTEALGGWARTVVIGRARLGGIPCGVIAVESRTVENVSPADPANPDSMEQVTNEAGGVWYPNSAFKTAQAINDFNNGEQLPLFILANWRGFSGGQRDMYNEVLKYGSYIVDALVKYKQPVFVYIPPHGELRGGSWVVVDPTINPEFMEMYADDDARGGVLEPDGIVGIKYKRAKLISTMERLDPAYAELKRRVVDKALSAAEQNKIKIAITQRENALLPIYTQIALQFADLHDRAGRMEAKGAIRKALQWPQARRFFFQRLRRRLLEERVLSAIATAQTKGGRGAASREARLGLIRAWSGIAMFDTADVAVADWLESNEEKTQARVDALERDIVSRDVADLLSSDIQAGAKGVRQVLSTMPVAEREKLLAYLSKV
jgi:acetyl-CoA carboxylase/biotin carboxylase 1